ncbi:MAG: TetR/AcrR family transcriptional regulator [Bosea sp.]|uniref:TetR/AcrR family transcriptional regulator n=1 Tax=Bosea sp. (in: a-proteobacteria) TaxID=1871050 RepID=UPI00238D35F8|nr:TetR/AcrR family transcriptional regulator [Bosea sp. (in: a-proteobacteria)]MCP4738898.1 TetR/AcrR family transcriptional regulator [Bosea sp. (in: a-proteobacteria)]
MSSPDTEQPRRQRLTREDRQRQLIETAWRIVGEEGTDALTLGRLAERAGVAKPVVYSHFTTRSGLLIALYRDFDAREYAIMNAAIDGSEATLAGKAGAIASSYVDCVLAQGREIPGVVAALAGSPELAAVKRDCDLIFLERCRGLLAPFAEGRTIPTAGLRAMLGAAEALSHAAATDEIGADEAKRELLETITAMVARSAKG